MSEEKFWETNLDQSYLNPFKDAPQSPEQIESVRSLRKVIKTFLIETVPAVTSMLQTLAIYFFLDALNFCEMYLEAHDPDYSPG